MRGYSHSDAKRLSAITMDGSQLSFFELWVYLHITIGTSIFRLLGCMKTILGFDSWTGGALNYVRLVRPLRELGYELMLIHLGSWGSEKARPMEEVIDALQVRDISYYKGMSFNEILKAETPVAVIFLSNDVFAHRAFNRYSLSIGIPTLRLYHGLVKVQAVCGERQYKRNFASQTKFILARVSKGLFKVWPCYLKALWHTGATGSDWCRFLADVGSQVKGQYIAVAAEDCQTSECAVYAPSDVSHAIEKYGYPPEHVHIVGNPDIMTFGLRDEHIGVAANAACCERNEVIYLDTGLIYAGMVYSSQDNFLDHLRTTRDTASAQGRGMVVKLHPRHFRTNLPDKLQEMGIELLNNDDFVPRLAKCAAAIVEPTTAALIPAIMGVPILLARYGKLADQVYGDVLLEYPRARILDNPVRLNTLLEEEAVQLDAQKVITWIRHNAGPLPAHLMPQRVAELVHRMASAEGRNA